MKRLILTAIVAVFSFSAHAAEVAVTKLTGEEFGGFAWQAMTTSTDSAQEVFWPGGCIQFHMQGTYDAKIMVMHRPDVKDASGAAIATTAVNIDIDNAPDGLYFNSATKANAMLDRGYVDLRFDSAGGATMNATLIGTPMNPWECI